MARQEVQIQDNDPFYDLKAAMASGAKADESGHWPSKFKLIGSPERFPIVDGKIIDSLTGQTPTAEDFRKNREAGIAKIGAKEYAEREREIRERGGYSLGEEDMPKQENSAKAEPEFDFTKNLTAIMTHPDILKMAAGVGNYPAGNSDEESPSVGSGQMDDAALKQALKEYVAGRGGRGPATTTKEFNPNEGYIENEKLRNEFIRSATPRDKFHKEHPDLDPNFEYVSGSQPGTFEPNNPRDVRQHPAYPVDENGRPRPRTPAELKLAREGVDFNQILQKQPDLPMDFWKAKTAGPVGPAEAQKIAQFDSSPVQKTDNGPQFDLVERINRDMSKGIDVANEATEQARNELFSSYDKIVPTEPVTPLRVLGDLVRVGAAFAAERNPGLAIALNGAGAAIKQYDPAYRDYERRKTFANALFEGASATTISGMNAKIATAMKGTELKATTELGKLEAKTKIASENIQAQQENTRLQASDERRLQELGIKTGTQDKSEQYTGLIENTALIKRKLKEILGASENDDLGDRDTVIAAIDAFVEAKHPEEKDRITPSVKKKVVDELYEKWKNEIAQKRGR